MQFLTGSCSIILAFIAALSPVCGAPNPHNNEARDLEDRAASSAAVVPAATSAKASSAVPAPAASSAKASKRAVDLPYVLDIEARDLEDRAASSAEAKTSAAASTKKAATTEAAASSSKAKATAKATSTA